MMSIAEVVRAVQLSPSMLAILCGAVILVLASLPWFVGSRADAVRVRRSMIDRHRQSLRSETLRRRRDRSTAAPKPFVNQLMAIFSLLPDRISKEKQKLLNSTGLFGETAFMVFWTVKFIAVLGGFATLIAYFLLREVGGDATLYWAALVGFIILFLLPDFVLRQRKATRLKALQRGLPDGLDLLVICAEAGLSLDAALKRVAEEFGAANPELAEELLLTSVELNFLPDRRQALMNLANRVELQGFRGVVNTLIQTEKYGTPLAATLRTLASEFREHRLLAAEEKAARLPAVLTVPMIVFILPALFIVLAAPAGIQISKQLMQ